MIEARVLSREIRRGQLFWCNLGDGDKLKGEQSGVRPVMVIQNNTGNKFSPTVIVCAITSKVDKFKKVPTHVLLNNCGLRVESVALLEQVYTVNKERLGDYIGEVDRNILKEIDVARNISLGDISAIDRLSVDIRDFVKKQLSGIYAYEEVISDTSDEIIIKSLLIKREEKLNKFEKYCEKLGINYKNFYQGYKERLGI